MVTPAARPTNGSSSLGRHLKWPMTSNRRGGAHPGRPHKPRQHSPVPKRSGFARVWRPASRHPLIVAVVGAVAGAVIAVPATLLIDNQTHQGAANEAAVQGERANAAAALSHDASEVFLGQGLHSPQFVIQNESNGWITNIALRMPVPFRETRERDGEINISTPSFGVYSPLFKGFTGVTFTAHGAYFLEPLPNIGPCELVTTTALESFPDQPGAYLAKAEIEFTDPNHVAWTRSISGPPVRAPRDTASSAGSWAPYPIIEPIPGCMT